MELEKFPGGDIRNLVVAVQMKGNLDRSKELGVCRSSH